MCIRDSSYAACQFSQSFLQFFGIEFRGACSNLGSDLTNTLSLSLIHI